MPTSDRGFNGILVAVDTLTHFAIMIPATGKISTTIARAFYQRINGRAGTTIEVITDGGHEFHTALEELLATSSICHRQYNRIHPHLNGTTERIIQWCQTAMRTLTAATGPRFRGQWDHYLPDIMLVYNTARTLIRPHTTGQQPQPSPPTETREN
jgi:hypothetical protein